MPAIVAMCLAGWFAVSQPGEIRKDAFEYDSIARNLVAGRGYAYQDQLTMNREPGYPVFRAVVYVLHGNEKTIPVTLVKLETFSIFSFNLSATGFKLSACSYTVLVKVSAASANTTSTPD